MRILMLSHYFQPKIGGVERVVKELADRISDIQLVIITEKHLGHLKDKEKYNNRTIIYRIKYLHIKYIGVISIWIWLLKNRRLIKQADIVHIHDVFIWYLPFKFLFPAKSVYITFHGWEGIYPIPFKNIVQKKLANLLCVKSICVGKFIEEYYRIKCDLITYGATNIPKRIEQKENKHIVYLGRLDRDTGLLIFLDALRHLKGFTVEFCGDGELAEVCRKYGNVHGFVDPKPFLRVAGYCFASGYLSILEAMANKCLVVTAYDNLLKKDYLQMAPFSKNIITCGSSQEILRLLRYYEKNARDSRIKIDTAYDWVKNQTWAKLTLQYQDLWRGNCVRLIK